MGRDMKKVAAAALPGRRTAKRAAAMRRRRWQDGRREAVVRKLRKLQRIIPGGHGQQPDRLFLLTADYILHLKLQLNLLQAISKLYL